MSEATRSGRSAADVEFIRALAALLDENQLTEIAVTREYDANDVLKVRVSRLPPPAPAAAPIALPPQHAQAIPAAHRAEAQAETAAGSGSGSSPGDPAEHPGAVTSPMVGTAYLSSEPGATPFVAVGQEVTAGQTLLIIEAMKTMNQIPAPRGGTVKRILVANGTPVEYGAPLMIIE